MRFFVFYPLVAIVAAALIVGSLGFSLVPIQPAPQDARQDKDALSFGPDQLAHIDQGDKQVLYVARGWNGAVEGVQLATSRAAGEPKTGEGGARLLIAPTTAAALKGRQFDVIVWYRQLYQNSATDFAVSLGAPAAGAWAAQPIKSEEGTLRFSFPASADEISSLNFWPVPAKGEYYRYYGVQLVGVRIQPQG